PIVRGEHHPPNEISYGYGVGARGGHLPTGAPADQDPHHQPDHQRADREVHAGYEAHLAIVSTVGGFTPRPGPPRVTTSTRNSANLLPQFTLGSSLRPPGVPGSQI